MAAAIVRFIHFNEKGGFGMVARFALMMLAVLMVSVPAVAREIAGIDVPEKVVQADGKELQLNGAGIRSKFFFKIYIAELFLEQTGDDAGKVLEFDGGKTHGHAFPV